MEEAPIKNNTQDDDSNVPQIQVETLIGEVTEAKQALVENLTAQASSYIDAAAREVESYVVSDSWASLKNIKPVVDQDQTTRDSPPLPTSDEKVGESSEAAKTSVDEEPRTTHTNTQAYVTLSPSTRASWADCCGLLDVLKRSDHQ